VEEEVWCSTVVGILEGDLELLVWDYKVELLDEIVSSPKAVEQSPKLSEDRREVIKV
jgi:hypothetical protein